MERLLFFDKEGYPYNFTYDSDNGRWDGKLIFDENGSDTYKTIGLYVFESVPEKEFDSIATFVGIEIPNYSGMSFHHGNETYYPVQNVAPTNSSSDFHTKWVYGTNYHTLFPRGSVVAFSGITGATLDFDSNYYSVMDTKPGAIMVSTQTDNSVFNASTFNIDSGVTMSVNATYVYEYDMSFSGQVYSIDIDEKISVTDSDSNDGVYTIVETGETFSYAIDYQLNGSYGDELSLEVELLNERPRIYVGDVHVNTTAVTFDDGIDSSVEVGTEFILETIDGEPFLASSNLYTITSIVTGETIGTGITLEFEEREIIDEEDITYWKNKIKASASWLAEVQEKADDSGITLNQMLEIEAYRLEKMYGNYEVRWYVTYPGSLTALIPGDTMRLSGTTTGQTNAKDFYILDMDDVNGNTEIRVQQRVWDEVAEYDVTKVLQPYEWKDVICTITGTPVVGDGEAIAFNTDNKETLTQTYLSGSTIGGVERTAYENTIDAFNDTHGEFLIRNGLKVHLFGDDLMMVESAYPSDELYLRTTGQTNSVNMTSGSIVSGQTTVYRMVVDQAMVNESNTLETGDLVETQELSIEFDLAYDLQEYGFNLNLNEADYYIDLSGASGTYSTDTVQYFVDTYEDAMSKIGFDLTASGDTLIVTTNNPVVKIRDYSVKVTPTSSYEASLVGSYGSIISANSITVSGLSLFDIGLATGMVINVTGSTYPTNNQAYNIIGLTDTSMELSFQGPFFDDVAGCAFRTREYIRKPRESYDMDVYYRFSWIPPVDDSIFIYDLSGENLEPYMGDERLRYVGPMPLVDDSSDSAAIIDEPNRDVTQIANPMKQQTVFDQVEFLLDQFDSSTAYDFTPVPLQVYLGFNSEMEGVSNNVLKMEKIEYITISGTSGEAINYFTIEDNVLQYEGYDMNFVELGIQDGQNISLRFVDTSETNQRIFPNYGNFVVDRVTSRKITFNTGRTMTDFNSSGATWNYTINVEPKEIARFSVYGETEIEDFRFIARLRNLGAEFSREDTKIFKDADINDDAIDYRLLNRKRKELLNVHTEIFNYVGSYKAIINAINFFGYNDLELHEYYKNINPDSALYGKLHKVLIPDMFDNSVEGWTEKDMFGEKKPDDYIKTNLFNLTYYITDEEGNPDTTYSLAEAQYKLSGLKKWLRKKVVPVYSDIRDITGNSSSMNTMYQFFDSSNNMKKTETLRYAAVVNFNYTATLNFGTNYVFQVNFYTGFTGYQSLASDVEYFDCRIKTFSKDTTSSQLILQQRFDIMKTDFDTFSFNVDKNVDPFVYIETVAYNSDGIGKVNRTLHRFDERKNYTLVHNVFHGDNYTPYIQDGVSFYLIDEYGNFYLTRT